MLNLLIDRDNCLNEHIIYYNFSVLFEKSFWNLSSFCQIYLSLLNLFLLFLSTFFVFLKSLNNYFFRWLAYKSFPSRFSVLIKCKHSIFFCIQLFPTFFMVLVFQVPGFSTPRLFRVQVFLSSRFFWVRFRIWVQVLEVAIK